MFISVGSAEYLFARDSDSCGDPLTRKLRSFRQLPQGWSHGVGVPLGADALRVAEQFTVLSSQLQLKADVFPGVNGECSVAFYAGERTVEVIIDPERTDRFGLHVEQGHGFDFARVVANDDATLEEAVVQITALVPQTWKSPVSSRSFSLTETGADFRMSFSSTSKGKARTRQTAS
ncbi:MAG: hypothetical protein ABL962_15030 [Fimbriimonadaceae bacterium]